MNNFTKGANREEKIDLFLDNLAWFHSQKILGDRTANSVDELVKELKEAGKSSGKLTEALNRITLFGVAIAGTGVAVALVSLAFEIYKYTQN